MGKFNNLPKEIMLEILTRLSTETVLECKLVCKQFWTREQGLSEICYTEYDENSNEKPFNRKTRIDLSLPFNKIHPVGSCNGLICFDKKFNGNYEPACVCNPITRKYIIIPEVEGICIAFGFGYTRSTNEYKVVRICCNVGDPIAQVYTLGSGNGWRDAGKVDMIRKHVGRRESGDFADGALHWLNYHQGTITVIAFHLATEKFSQLPPPPPCLTPASDSYFFTLLGVLGDFLCATVYYHACVREIWLFKKDKGSSDCSWSKEFSFVNQTPFEFTRSGRLLCHQNDKIYGYDSKDSSAKMDVSFGKSISRAICHKNTLVSLRVLGEEDTKTMKSRERASSSEKTESSA